MLTAANLTRTFGGRLAVDHVSFEVAPGEVFALLGPNGAGKTTIMRMLAGLIAPSSGSVAVAGERLHSGNASRLRARIGLLTESPGLWDQLPVRLNLLTYARLFGVTHPEQAVDRVLALFEIASRAPDAAATLSKGLRQRVALARTLLHDPAIVLLDEPTSGLDPESARDVRRLIQRLRGEGRAVLLSTHNLDEVERVATRVAVLNGRLIAVDTPHALRQRLFGTRVAVTVRRAAEEHAGWLRDHGVTDVTVEGQRLSVSVDGAVAGAVADTPSLVRLLVARGAEIEAVAAESAALEDVYLRLLDRAAP
jgi:ABC-2 type transport system ATP-binding protein